MDKTARGSLDRRAQNIYQNTSAVNAEKNASVLSKIAGFSAKSQSRPTASFKKTNEEFFNKRQKVWDVVINRLGGAML